MNARPTIPPGLLAALLLASAAAALLPGAAAATPTTAAARPQAMKPKPKPTKPNAAITRQIVELERTTNTLSGEIAALTARATTLEGSVRAPLPAPLAGDPTPAPPTPAGGDFTGSFPDPTLKPGTVGALQLGEGSVTSDQIIDGSVGARTIAPRAITFQALGVLGAVDLGATAVNGRTLAMRKFTAGESQLFEEGVPREQTLTLSAHCDGRVISGGWKLVPGELGAQVMASVPAFVAGGKSSEHDWNITVHEEFTNTTIRNRMDVSGLCIE